MDHITKLYQNRAKVLQEEVNRLEGLLEAVVDAPPIKMRQGVKNEAAANAKAEAEAEAVAKAAADAEIKKTEEARKDIEKNPISGRIVSGLKSTGEAISNIGNVFDNPYVQAATIGTLGSVAYGLATPRIIPGAPMDKTASSIFHTHKWDMGVNKYTGLPDTSYSTVVPKGKRSWNIFTNPLGFRGTLMDRIVSKIGKQKGLQQEIASIKAAEEAKAIAAANELSLERTQKKLISRTANNIQPGEVGLSGELLRDPNLKIGERGSMKDAGIDVVRERVKAATATESGVEGGRLTAGAEKMLRQKNSPVLRSIGAITPEDVEMAMQGAKDVAMTGKEVAGKVGRAATTPLPGSSSAVVSGLSKLGAGVVGGLAGEYLVKPAAEKAGVFKAVESGTRSALSAAPDWVAKVADPALGAAQVILDPLSSAVSAMQKPMEQGAEKEAEELVKRAGSPSKIRFTGKSKI